MLERKNRIDKKTMEELFNKGRFVNSPCLTLKYLIYPTKMTRISFIVPKTVSKKAIVRNQLKRRGYVEIKKQIPQIPAGFLGAFIFKKGSVEIFGGKKGTNYNPNLNLEKEIQITLNKL